MDRESVGFLLCIICKRPLENPRRTPCGHIFCFGCIIRWISTKANSCPACRKYVSFSSLSFVSDIFYDLLDNLHVNCMLCGQQDIPRRFFNYHIENICPNVAVPCHYADIKYSCIGRRSQFSNHFNACNDFESARPISNELFVENRQLIELCRQQLYQNKKLQDYTQRQHAEIIECFSTKLDQYRDQIRLLSVQRPGMNIED